MKNVIRSTAFALLLAGAFMNTQRTLTDGPGPMPLCPDPPCGISTVN